MKNHKVVVRNLWRRAWLEATKQAVGRANWKNYEQAKVFKAHAVPQGLCANFINALTLLANQQEDGDGPQQNIVRNRGKDSRKGLTDGLRDFIWVDNERALDVGALRGGTGTLKVRKPQVPEGRSDVIIRESPDELTSRPEEVETSNIEPERWGLPWLMLTGMPSVRRCTKAWEDMYDSYKVMSRIMGAKKPQEAQ